MSLIAIYSIVFVHGLTGGRESTWTEKKTGTFWPKDLLPKDIPEARIFTFGYDTDIGALNCASTNTIRDHGKALANHLALKRMRTKSVRIAKNFILTTDEDKIE